MASVFTLLLKTIAMSGGVDHGFDDRYIKMIV